jgi:hypothetical protein
MAAPLWTCKQTLEHGVVTCIISQDQEIQKLPSVSKSDVDTLLGL